MKVVAHVAPNGWLRVTGSGYTGEAPDVVGEVVGEVIAEALHRHVLTGLGEPVTVERVVESGVREIGDAEMRAALAWVPNDRAGWSRRDTVLADAVVRLVDDDGIGLIAVADLLEVTIGQARRWYEGDT